MSPIGRAYLAIIILVVLGAGLVWWGMMPPPPGASVPPAPGTPPAPVLNPEAEAFLEELDTIMIADVDGDFGEIDAELNAL